MIILNLDSARCYEPSENDIVIFLSGGINDDTTWRDTLITELEKYDTGNLVLIQPFSKLIPEYGHMMRSAIELDWIDRCDIFAAYLSATESPHPFTIFEVAYVLGKPVQHREVIITIEDGYSKEDKLVSMAVMANMEYGKRWQLIDELNDLGVRIQDITLNAYDDYGNLKTHVNSIIKSCDTISHIREMLNKLNKNNKDV